jgi:hypothetical protein
VSATNGLSTVDPISTLKKPDWGFAIVVKHAKDETLTQRITVPNRKGSAKPPIPCGLK